MARILLVEDQPANQVLVKTVLTGHEIVFASTLKEAREKMSVDFDLVLLDVQLPDGDGFSYFIEMSPLAAEAGIPVMFLTAKNDVADRVTGYTLGADDYIAKPLEPVEFRARVEAKLRKRQTAKAGEAVFKRDGLVFSLAKQSVTIEATGKRLSLT